MTNDDEFRDIKIVGPDEELTHVPDKSRPAMYHVYLELSGSTPVEWSQLFDETWKMRLYSKKRRAWVEGNYIVIHCTLDEMEKDHKPELLAAIADVNEKYKRYAAQQSKRRQDAAANDAVANTRKKDSLRRLKFE